MTSPDPRALHPNLIYGRGLLAQASRDWGDYLLVTMPAVWDQAQKLITKKPAHILQVSTMDLPTIEKIERELPQADTIVGIGGGMVADMAKFIGWKRGQEPVLAPSAASVDAPVCTAIAVRENHRVKYLGRAISRAILVDFDLVQSAPKSLNRAGIGDLLSIHTALWDWKLAAERGKGSYDAKAAAATAAILEQMEKMAEEIREVTEKAVRWLMESFAEENRVCLAVGNSRPEEGSEHFFAYNIENHTGRAFVHGELVCLGVALISKLQENDESRVMRILAKTGVRYQPAELKLSRKDVEKALRTLKSYVEKEGLFYSVVNERAIDEKMVEAICSDLVF